jgi:tRNA nucleotidyltransferase (CCA-adding enzyme)
MEYYLSDIEQQQLEQIITQHHLIKKIITTVHEGGGTAFLVGGAVRDILLHMKTTDIDIEIHHLSIDRVQEILQRFGEIELVGKSFGVLIVKGILVEWALPRSDSAGRKPAVVVDKDMPIEIALRRRDVTMNAMAINLRSLMLIDPFGGKQDLEKKVLRATDPAFFVEDPLRLYRVMQFIARFQLQPDATLTDVCARISLAGLSRERIAAEFTKLFMNSSTPSRGLRWLAQIGRLQEILPELAATQGVLQEYAWHPEGDVFEHTMQALDAAAQQSYYDEQEKCAVVYAVLCHDLGKVTTTKIQDGRIRSSGHDEAGVPLARSLMRRISLNKRLHDIVALLVRHHMSPGMFVHEKATAAAYKRLAVKLAPFAHLRMLALLAYADKRGRNPQRGKPLMTELPDIDEFARRAEQYGVLLQPEKPVLQGADLMGIVPPGAEMGNMLRHAYEIQINKGIIDKDELIKRVRSSSS